MDWTSIINSVLSYITSFGGLSVEGKIAGALLVLIGIWKSSAAQPLWNWIPATVKPWIAPAFGLIYGLVSVSPFSWANLLAAAGVGAVGGMLATAIVQMLELVKAIPGLGALYVAIISLAETVFQAPPAVPPAANPPAAS